MIDIFDLFFGAGPAITRIMELGFMPKDEDFLELTSEQYSQFYKEMGYTEEKVFALLPKTPGHYVASDFNELNVCTESDIATLKRGWQIIENLCAKSDNTFGTDRQKLMFAASRLPDVFSKGTPFECAHSEHLSIASINDSVGSA